MHSNHDDVKYMHDLKKAAPEMVAACLNVDETVFS